LLSVLARLASPSIDFVTYRAGGRRQSKRIEQLVNTHSAIAQGAFPRAQEIGAAEAVYRNEDAQYTVDGASVYRRKDVTALGAAALGCGGPIARFGHFLRRLG